ncbi:MAG: sigma 54-interacting transcriptional regulator [Acidobacteria bacterium]|nr:sigma 54-interacting transcriptional regulator [Acidobacteriota bacterium]
MTDLKQKAEINPRLVVIAGPLQGKVFTLTEPECLIGREPSNQICLIDLSVSRRHCRIQRDADKFIIRDLESLNCTFVNGVPIRERPLAHGDLLKIGGSVFIFLLCEDEAPQASPPVGSGNGHCARTTVAQENIERLEWLEQENRRLQEEINLEHNMVGESPRMREVYQFIAKVAPAGSTVLIRGESGAGKELVARAIHQNSPRAHQPFVAINCAALTETLLESELFGHEKGAFTGAIAQKKGKLEIAQGGTVFLDEMGEMAPYLQASLLRVLQEREFERVGGTRPIKADIRVIAATNKDLEAAIKNGGFRQDLYYRLNVVSITMPPLRERREDIPLLAGYFAVKYSQKCKRAVKGISAKARARLLSYDWPGNVRELENAIERAVVLGLTEFILPEDLPEVVLETGPPAGAESRKLSDQVKEAKKRFILEAIEQAGGNITKAAELLDVNISHLHWLIRTLELRPALKPRPFVPPDQTQPS